MKILVALAMLAAFAPPAKTRTLRDLPFTPLMAVIPPGRATLGSSEAETTREGRTPTFALFEHPQHDFVNVKPFAIGVHHVTRGEFAVFAAATRRPMNGCIVLVGGKWSNGPDPSYSWSNPGWKQGEDEPVTCVSWDDAVAYARWLSAKTGKHYRLPSEAEWEYAVRAGTATARWWGDAPGDICARVNGGDRSYAAVYPEDKSANLTCSDGFSFTSPVDHFPANPWGLRDTYGNAWQWVADCFVTTPASAVQEGGCASHAIRGGSWHSSISTLRSATRFSLPTGMRSSSLGFRVMREMD